MSVVDSGSSVEPVNPCVEKKDHCLNCHSHLMAVRPPIRNIVVTKRFFKDLRDKEKVKAIVRDYLDCFNSDFYESHKFGKHVNGCMIFRAKTEKMHIVYCVDKNMQIIFMRVFKNFKEYEKLLNDKNEIGKLIRQA